MKKWITIINDGVDTILDVRYEDEEGALQLFDGETLMSKHPLKGNQIIVPEGVTRIADYAFGSDHLDKEYNKILSITISSSVKSIGDKAFNGCEHLKTITVVPTNKVYDSRNNCNAIIETITGILIKGCQNTKIPYGVEKIGWGAFECCRGLTGIDIPNSVKEIGECAFSECLELTAIDLPNSLEEIGCSAFYGTGLSKIHIPYNVKVIGAGAFANCEKLHSVEIPDDIICFTSFLNYDDSGDYDEIFEGCPCIINKYRVYKHKEGRFNPVSLTGAVNVGRNSIGRIQIGNQVGGFADCRKITSIIIADGVTSIENFAFENCTSLESVTIPNSVTSIGAAAFRGCKKLKSIKIPYQVTHIEQYTFEGCKELESVELSKSTVRIDREAFSGCKRLKNIELPESLSMIGVGVFTRCIKLKNIELPESLSMIGVGAFDFCNSLNEIIIHNKDIIFSDLLTKKEDYFFGVNTGKITLVLPEEIDRFRLRSVMDVFSPDERRVEYL